MPPSPVKKDILRLRRGYVQYLLQFPLSLSEIGYVIGYDKTTAHNDEAFLAREQLLPQRPSDSSFSARLKLAYSALKNELEHLEEDQRQRLASMILRQAVHDAKAILAGVTLRQTPDIAEDLLSAQRLVEAIFQQDPLRSSYFDFHALLLDWCTSETCDFTSIECAHDLALLLVKRFIAQRRSTFHAHVVVTLATKHVLREAYSVLNGQQRLVIERRFPKDGSPGKTLKEIGDELDVSFERVQQIIPLALNRLRDVLVAHHDVSPVSLLDVDVVALRQELTEAHKQREELEARLKVVERERDALLPMLDERRSEDGVGSQALQLLRRVNTLRRSTRLRLCLEREGFEYLWQVCEKSEYYMLGVKNFGDTTLDELKALLEPLGLTLGMTIPESIKGR